MILRIRVTPRAARYAHGYDRAGFYPIGSGEKTRAKPNRDSTSRGDDDDETGGLKKYEIPSRGVSE